VRTSAIIGSVVLHFALLAAAFALPPVATRPPAQPITVDMITPRQRTEPPTPEPLKPEPPKIAMRDPHRPVEPEPEPELKPEAPEPPTPAAPTPPTSGTIKPAGKLDLTLHSLPGEEGVPVPSGTGTIIGPSDRNTNQKPWKMRGDAGNPLTGKIAEESEDRFPLRPVGRGEYEYKGKAFSARIMRDGRVSFDDKNIRDFKGLSGGFDVTDLLMKAKHQDPYRAEKQAFMNYTDAMRRKMAVSALKERQAASLEHLPEHLDEVWHNHGHPVEWRHKEMYEMWLDAAMSQADTGDAAKEACNIIETYVRRYLPADGEDAYTEDELAKLNHGKSFKFAPYR
jgi:hypothetical protein